MSVSKGKYAFGTAKDAYKAASNYAAAGHVAPFPPYVTFELRNGCNFRCVMCPRTYMTSDSREMDIEMLRRHIDEIARYGSLVRFIGWDEPLLYSKIQEAISCVKESGLLLHITTNGSLLDDSIIRHIVDNGVDSIIVSFQGLTQQEYCFMRKVAPSMYARVIDGIQRLSRARRGGRPRLTVTTTITERDRPEDKDEFVNFHCDHADEVQITGFTDLTAIAEGFDRPTIWNELAVTRPTPKTNIRCFLPNYEMKIRWDGTLFTCCPAFNEDIGVLPIGEETLLARWTSRRVSEIRETVGQGDLDRFQDCRMCSIRYAYPKLNNPIANTVSKSFESFSAPSKSDPGK
jgi:MoaA/NifB/PqqE/SkfB family radical SAM enzyme